MAEVQVFARIRGVVEFERNIVIERLPRRNNPVVEVEPELPEIRLPSRFSSIEYDRPDHQVDESSHWRKSRSWKDWREKQYR